MKNIFLFCLNDYYSTLLKNKCKNMNIKKIFDKYDILENCHYNNLSIYLSDLKENDIVINLINLSTDRKYLKYNLYKSNSVFPLIVSFFCKEKGAKYIHLSNDIFEINNKINEFTFPETNNDIKLSRILGEFNLGTIIRTNILDLNNDKQYIHNYYSNAITTLELINKILEIIEKDLYWSGVRHLYSPKKYLLSDIFLHIKEKYNKKYNLILEDNYNEVIYDSIFNLNYTLKNKNIEEQIKEFFDN
jgi:hypothetical protein